MAKLKDGLVRKHDERTAFEKHQEALRQKHNIENKIENTDNKIIVEKKSAVKYLILGAGNTLQVLASIVILGLALIGLTSLALPSVRQTLLMYFQVVT